MTEFSGRDGAAYHEAHAMERVPYQPANCPRCGYRSVILWRYYKADTYIIRRHRCKSKRCRHVFESGQAVS
jgi:hypothetical protein